MSYQIITDSCCDFPKDLLGTLNITTVPLTLTFRDQVWTDTTDEGLKTLFAGLRNGESASTSAANPEDWARAIEPVLKNGEDALVLTFSSGLSTTYQSAVIASKYMEEHYPDRKVIVVDSLCAALGQGLLVKLACDKRDAGLSIEENAAWVEANKLNLCHWFTVDDLKYLKRGGRISAAKALMGTMLNIKPVLSVTMGEIHLLGKARGSKMGNNLLVQEIDKAGGIDFTKPVLLGYSGISNALLLKYIEDSRHIWEGNLPEIRYTTVGSVIGTHAGPGAVVVAFFKN